MGNTVKEIIKDINNNLKQTSSSQKDEVTVMQAMLNDKGYKVKVYNKGGNDITEYCPAEDYRSMCANVIASTAKMPKAEAAKLVEDYDVSKTDAASMVNVSKEFVNTYLSTGRKLPFGGRSDSNYALSIKNIPASVKTYPKKVGVNEDGTARYENGQKNVPAHKSIRAYGPCPVWVK